jgi:hypothetical protein
MPTYRIYLRSFAPWRQFGTLFSGGSIPIPAVSYHLPSSPFDSGVSIGTVPLQFGGAFHGDGRGFSLETGSPRVTARVNATLEVQMPGGIAGKKEAWCDESHGPSMGVGFENSAVGVPNASFDVSKGTGIVKAIIEYGASNPLVTGAPDINAKGEFQLSLEGDQLTIVSTITGDQFPACEAFIEDPKGNKIFLGGFAPANKNQILRLAYGGWVYKDVWFESEIVATIDKEGVFQKTQGGGSGSNSTGPSCEGFVLPISDWNARIMSSIPMPSDTR